MGNGIVFGAPNGAIIKTIQTGTVSISSTSQTVTITSVDTTKSVVIAEVITTGLNAAQRTMPYVVLTNATTITFTCNATGGTVTVKWTVVEYKSRVTVQRGTGTITGTSSTSNVTISAVTSTVKALAYTSATSSYFNASLDLPGSAMTYGVLTTTTNLAVTRGNNTSATTTFAWQVINFI